MSSHTFAQDSQLLVKDSQHFTRASGQFPTATSKMYIHNSWEKTCGIFIGEYKVLKERQQ
jgi:hypothetical protein